MLKKYWPDPIVVLIPLLSGLILSILFALDIIIPVDIGAPLIYAATIWGLVFVKTSTTSLLPRLMIGLYSLPFSTTINYLFHEEHIWWRWPPKMIHEWHEKIDPVPLIQNTEIISTMVMLGLIGLLGLITGISLHARSGKVQVAHVPANPSTLPATIQEDASRLLVPSALALLSVPRGLMKWKLAWGTHETHARFQPQPPLIPTKRAQTLGYLAFLAGLAIVVLLSWIFAPAESIFIAGYKKSISGSIAASINFRSAFQVASILLILLFIDAERDRLSRQTKHWKYIGVITITLFVAVFFQLLRGERDVMGVFAALTALTITTPSLARRMPRIVPIEWRRVLLFVFPVSLTVVAALFIGVVREELSKGSLDDMSFLIQRYWRRSQWNSVLLTPLFLTESYVSGSLEYEYGQTYVEYVLSLPPGMITRAMGIERPIDRQFGEAWGFSRKSAGGIHIAVLPFKNFGIAGLFIILGIYGYLIGYFEKANASATFWPRLLYGTVVATSIFWFWYGDITMIRGFMIAALAGIMYQGWLQYAPPFRPLVSFPKAHE